MSFGIGQPVTRTEDPRFLTGRGTFVDDITLAGQAHAVVVYSTVAHADIKAIDTARAEASPGVVAVLTGAEAEADAIGGFPPLFMPEDMGGPKGYRTIRPVIARHRVRHVGERVALVVAETEAQARDGAELVQLDYGSLPAVVSAADCGKRCERRDAIGVDLDYHPARATGAAGCAGAAMHERSNDVAQPRQARRHCGRVGLGKDV